MLSIKNKNKKMPIIIASSVAVLLVAVGVAYLQKDTITGWFSGANNNKTDNTPAKIDTDPEPKNDQTDNSSGSGSDNQSNNGSGQSSLKTINVVINDASQYDSAIEVRSYAEGVVETGGSCKITFEKDGQSITKTTETLTNPSYTTCATVDVPISEFTSNGTWKVTVEYTSSTSKGSATTSVEVK